MKPVAEAVSAATGPDTAEVEEVHVLYFGGRRFEYRGTIYGQYVNGRMTRLVNEGEARTTESRSWVTGNLDREGLRWTDRDPGVGTRRFHVKAITLQEAEAFAELCERMHRSRRQR